MSMILAAMCSPSQQQLPMLMIVVALPEIVVLVLVVTAVPAFLWQLCVQRVQQLAAQPLSCLDDADGSQAL